MCIYPGVLQPPTLTPFWWTVESRWCLEILMPTIPPGSPEQEMIGQRPEGKRLMGSCTVRSPMLQTKSSLLTSPPDITLLSGHILPDVTWSTLTTLGTYHLPITVSLSSYAPLSPQKAHSYTNFHKADWEGFTAESERRFAETLLPTSCSDGEKVIRGILSDAGRYYIPCGYVRDYCGPLPDVVRPIFTETDQRRTDDPLTLPSSCWTGTSSGSFTRKRKTSGGPSWSPPTAPPIPSATSLRCKQGGKRSSPPPNSIAFEKKKHSSSKAIAQAFNKQFTACSAQQDRALRRPMRGHHLVDSSGRPFDERGVTAVILKADSSTAHGPDGLTVLYHIGEHGLAFLTELFNLLVAEVDITANWKNSVLIPILKAGKPRDQGCSYSNISLHFAAVKILERLLLPSIVEALGGTRSSQHGFKPRH